MPEWLAVILYIFGFSYLFAIGISVTIEAEEGNLPKTGWVWYLLFKPFVYLVIACKTIALGLIPVWSRD